MPTILESKIEMINDKMKFSCLSGENPPIITDYIPPLGDNEGYMPLELFLISLSTCLGGTIAPILRKMRKDIIKLQITSKGIRKDEHPTGFSKVSMNIIIVSEDIESKDIEKAVKYAEDTFCPVISMVKGNVELEIKHEIIKP